MTRSEQEQTGKDYFEMYGALWQPESARGDVMVVKSLIPDLHMQVIAAGLAVQWQRTVCGIEDLTGREWTVTPEDGSKLLHMPLSEIISRPSGSEPRMK